MTKKDLKNVIKNIILTEMFKSSRYQNPVYAVEIMQFVLNAPENRPTPDELERFIHCLKNHDKVCADAIKNSVLGSKSISESQYDNIQPSSNQFEDSAVNSIKQLTILKDLKSKYKRNKDLIKIIVQLIKESVLNLDFITYSAVESIIIGLRSDPKYSDIVNKLESLKPIAIKYNDRIVQQDTTNL